jgi:hypothetical protein
VERLVRQAVGVASQSGMNYTDTFGASVVGSARLPAAIPRGGVGCGANGLPNSDRWSQGDQEGWLH